MRLSNPAILLGLLLSVVIIFGGCGSSPGNSNTTSPEIARRVPSVPFPTTEPETYSTDLVTSDNNNERRYSIARDGIKQRIEFEVGTDRHLIWIKNEQTYIIDPQKKIFAEQRSGETQSFPADFISDLTNQLLTAKYETDFEFVKNDAGMDVYRAVVNDSSGSETLIYIDKNLNLPVKTEYYSINGDSKELRTTSRLENFRPMADAAMFIPPTGFRKASYSDVIR